MSYATLEDVVSIMSDVQFNNMLNDGDVYCFKTDDFNVKVGAAYLQVFSIDYNVRMYEYSIIINPNLVIKHHHLDTDAVLFLLDENGICPNAECIYSNDKKNPQSGFPIKSDEYFQRSLMFDIMPYDDLVFAQDYVSTVVNSELFKQKNEEDNKKHTDKDRLQYFACLLLRKFPVDLLPKLEYDVLPRIKEHLEKLNNESNTTRSTP